MPKKICKSCGFIGEWDEIPWNIDELDPYGSEIEYCPECYDNNLEWYESKQNKKKYLTKTEK